MKITILGSGTCVPLLKRSSCSVLVQIENNNLVFDSGPGTMRRLLRAGLTINDVSHLFYSHFHPDHIGELVPWLFATKYPETYRRRQPFTIIAAKGFSAFYENLKIAYGHWIELGPDLLTVVELDNQGSDHLNCKAFDVAHGDDDTVVYIQVGDWLAN